MLFSSGGGVWFGGLMMSGVMRLGCVMCLERVIIVVMVRVLQGMSLCAAVCSLLGSLVPAPILLLLWHPSSS